MLIFLFLEKFLLTKSVSQMNVKLFEYEMITVAFYFLLKYISKNILLYLKVPDYSSH